MNTKLDSEEMLCRLYLRTNLPRESVVKIVADVTSGDTERYSVEAPPFSIDVLRNDERDERSESFVKFPFFVEVYAPLEFSQLGAVALISELMIELAKTGAAVVASCDWEDELPGKGRIDRPIAPQRT